MKHREVRVVSCLYLLSLILLVAFAGRGLQETMAVSREIPESTLIIVDAGHGEPDGGCSAADGTKESDINLSISKKTDAILGLLGEDTLMTRTGESDLSDADATTIAEKKISDIRNRTDLVNQQSNAILVSIHQNTYREERYFGAQVFYGIVGNSQLYGQRLQQDLRLLNPENRRMCKKVSAEVYLMNHVTVPALLVECGFLSNQKEAENLKSNDYQTKLAMTVAVSISNSLQTDSAGI